MKPIRWLIVSIMVSCCLSPAIQAADSTSISISGNGRYFLNGNGVPWFWLGDTQWDLFSAFTTANAQTMCNNRRDKGIYALQVMIFGVAGPTSNNINGQKPFINDNVATPNEPYFSHIDSIIDAAHKSGVVLIIGLYHSSRTSLLTLSNVRQWGTYVGQRFAAKKNIIWCSYPGPNTSFLPLLRELAAGLQAGDTGNHLITVHPDPPGSASVFQTEPWLDFDILQTWASDRTNYTMVASDYAKTPTKPVINGEARYETEGGTTPFQVRNGAYWSVCAGGFYSYGHGGNWLSPWDWKNWMDSPGVFQMKVLGDLFRSISWWKLVPDQTIFSTTAGQNAAARSSDSNWVLVYLPAAGSATIRLDKISAADSSIAQWIDPITGNPQAIGTFASTGTRAFTSPNGWADAVLLVKAKNASTVAASTKSSRLIAAKSAIKMSINNGFALITHESKLYSLHGRHIKNRLAQNRL